jgi:hypothetical protein
MLAAVEEIPQVGLLLRAVLAVVRLVLLIIRVLNQRLRQLT